MRNGVLGAGSNGAGGGNLGLGAPGIDATLRAVLWYDTHMATDEEVFCPQCGYNLFGIPERRCPECGFGFDREAVQSLAQEYVGTRWTVYRRVIIFSITTVCLMLLPLLNTSLSFLWWPVLLIAIALAFYALAVGSAWLGPMVALGCVMLVIVPHLLAELPWLAGFPAALAIIDLIGLPRNRPYLARTVPEETRKRLKLIEVAAFISLGLSIVIFVISLL